MMTRLTEAAALKIFSENVMGEQWDDDDYDYFTKDIGNPDAQIPATRTHETIDDFVKSGWKDQGDHYGTTCMTKFSDTIYIADLGNSRLVHVER